MPFPFFPFSNFQNCRVFEIADGLQIQIPQVIDRALEKGADLAVSCSGGKDSDAQLRCLVALHRSMGYPGKIFAVFADLGRIEWIGVVEHVKQLCTELGIELVIVKRPQGGLIDRWDQRMASIAVDTVLKLFRVDDSQKTKLKKAIQPQLPSVLFPDDAYEVIFDLAIKQTDIRLNEDGDWTDCANRIVVERSDFDALMQCETIGDRPHFSSSVNRFCTDHNKTSQVDKLLRTIGDRPHFSSSANRYCTADNKRLQIDGRLRQSQSIVCAVGIRADESPGRRKEPRYCVRNQISARYLKTPSPEKGIEKEYVSRMEEDWADQALDIWLNSDMEGRLALTWHPIHHFSLEQVWQANGTSLEELQHRQSLWKRGHYREAVQGFVGHWAYVASNSRLSCTQCVMAKDSDISNGAMYHPLEWFELALSESLSGWSFKQDYWLMDLSQKIQGLDLKQRRVILRILGDLGLIQKWPRRYALDFLEIVPVECLQFWTVAFLEGLINALKEGEAEQNSLHLLQQ